jgi:hypothetical protein
VRATFFSSCQIQQWEFYKLIIFYKHERSITQESATGSYVTTVNNSENYLWLSLSYWNCLNSGQTSVSLFERSLNAISISYRGVYNRNFILILRCLLNQLSNDYKARYDNYYCRCESHEKKFIGMFSFLFL